MDIYNFNINEKEIDELVKSIEFIKNFVIVDSDDVYKFKSLENNKLHLVCNDKHKTFNINEIKCLQHKNHEDTSTLDTSIFNLSTSDNKQLGGNKYSETSLLTPKTEHDVYSETSVLFSETSSMSLNNTNIFKKNMDNDIQLIKNKIRELEFMSDNIQRGGNSRKLKNVIGINSSSTSSFCE